MGRWIVRGGVRDACVECVFGGAVEQRWRRGKGEWTSQGQVRAWHGTGIWASVWQHYVGGKGVCRCACRVCGVRVFGDAVERR